MITKNPNNGVLGFEYPNPFTPENGFEGTIFFQLAGNRISGNSFAHNGAPGKAFTGDVTLAGGFSEIFNYPESHSVNNCVSANLLSDATFPAKIQGTWGCQNKTTPSPGGGLPAVEYLVGLQLEADAIREATPPVGRRSRRHSRPCPTRAAGRRRTRCARDRLSTRRRASSVTNAAAPPVRGGGSCHSTVSVAFIPFCSCSGSEQKSV